MKYQRKVAVAMLTAALLVAVVGTGNAAKPPATATATWTGGGSASDGTTRTLVTSVCDENTTPYLQWVLAGSGARSAKLNIGGQSLDMNAPVVDKKTGLSTFKLKWLPGAVIDLDALMTAGVTATYSDPKKATLTVGQGCLGSTSTSDLTIVFLGELITGTPNSFVSLGTRYGTSLQLCEATIAPTVPTNCVTFSSGSAVNTTRHLSLPAAGSQLMVVQTNLQFLQLFSSAISADTAAQVFPGCNWGIPIGGMDVGSPTSGRTFQNGDTVYWVNFVPLPGTSCLTG